MSNIRNMKLEVVLAAIDKATKPIKAVMGSSSGLSKQLKETKDKLKELGRQQETLEKFKDTSRGLAVTKHQLQGATEKLAALKQELAQTEYPTKKLTEAIRIQQTETDKLRLRHGKLYAQSVQLQQGLKDYGLETKNLTAQQKRLKAEAEALNPVLDQQKAKLERLNKLQSARIASRARYDKGLENRDRLAGAGASMMAAGATTGAAVTVPISAYAQAEDAAMQLRVSMMEKGGKVKNEYADIVALSERLGNRLPGTTAEFQEMMTTLNRQGMSAKAILGGVGEASAYLGVQLKLPYSQAAEYAAKMQDATSALEKDMMGVMDTIQRTYQVGVDPGNMVAGFAKLAPVLDMIKQKGLAGAQTMAPLLAMADQASLVGESAGNAYRKVFQRSMDADKIAKGNQLAKGAGIKFDFTDGKGEFGGLDKMFNQLAQLKKLNTQQRNAVIAEIWGDDAETLQALNVMIDKGQSGYREMQQKMAAQASLQERVNAQLGTLKNLWDAAAGTFTNAMVRFGEAIAPELKALTEWIANISERLGNWAKENPELANTLMKIAGITAIALTVLGGLAVGIAGVLGPIIAFRFAIAMARTQLGSLIPGMETAKKALGGLHTAWSYAGRGVSWFSKQAGVAFTAFRAALPAVLSAARAFGSGLLQAFFAPIKLLLQGAFFVLKTTLRSLPGLLVRVAQAFAVLARFLLMNPIGLAVTVIAGGAYLIWSNWSTLGPKFSALWDGIKAGASSLWDGIKNAASSAFTAVSSAVASVWANIKQAFSGGILGVSQLIINWSPLGLFYQAFAAVMNYFGVSMPAKFTDFGRNILQGLVNGITSSMGAVKAAISGAGAATIAWFKQTLGIHSPSRVFAELGGFTMEGLQQGIAGGQGGPLGAVMNVAKKLTAAGAGIAIGATSGLAAAVPMDTRPPISAARAPAVASAASPITINIHAAPGMNEQQLAQLVAREVERIQRQTAARGRSRLTDKD